MAFTTFPIPTQELATLDPTEFPLTALRFTPNQVWNGAFIGHNVWHGNFWTASDTPGDCFWEAWVAASYGAEYVISAGQGGSHPVLFGFNGAGSGKLKLSGNVYNGGGNTSFTSIDGVDPDTWHHIAMGVDHTTNFIYVYLDGVLTDQVAFSGTRTVGAGATDLGLYVGGSDHSNFKGKILRLRGFEDQIPFSGGAFPGAFLPQSVFTSTWDTDGNGTIEYAAQFLADYSKVSDPIADLSSGYNGTTHSGVRAMSTFGAQARYDQADKLPQWVVADFEPPQFSDTPESIPVDSIFFDDFSRDNSTFAWVGTEYADWPGLGTARTGQSWVGNLSGVVANKSNIGIIEGSAASTGNSVANGSISWADIGETDYTYTIDRLGTGAITAVIRLEDKDNYYMVAMSSTGVNFYNVISGTPALVSSGTAPTDPNWTRATLVVSGTTCACTITGGGGGTKAIDASLTGESVGFAIAGVSRVTRVNAVL